MTKSDLRKGQDLPAKQ